MFKAAANSLLAIVFPQQCHVCSGPVEDLDVGVACRRCWSGTRIFTGSEMLCVKCGAYFGKPAASANVFCRKCDDHVYDKAAAVGVYETALSACIVNLKSQPVLPRYIAAAISPALLRTDFFKADVIIPTPLARQRQLERGYNQADVIANKVSKVLRIPVDAHSLKRKLHTPMHRMGMDQRARELTVQGAFEVVRPAMISGKSVLLVDDVFTSGATASYCAKALKKNGAVEVNVFTLARTVMN